VEIGARFPAARAPGHIAYRAPIASGIRGAMSPYKIEQEVIMP